MGAYVTPNNFYRATWHRACRELGIKGLTFHATRHTFASKCLHAGATPQEVAAWLGDTLEVFYRHYAHVIEGLRDGTLDCIATDHAPHARDEKEVPFEEAPFGTTGLETAFASVYTELVVPGVLPSAAPGPRQTAS